MKINKRIKLLLLIVPFLMMSCGEKGDEQLKKENQELKSKIEAMQSYVDEVSTSINDIQNALNKINTQTGDLKTTLKIEQGQNITPSQKDEIKNKIEAINKQFADNKAKLNALKKSMKDKDIKIEALENMISSLEASVKEKEGQIIQLEDQVKGLNIQILSLKETVATKEKEISDKDKKITEQTEDISSKTKEINSAFYIMGTYNDLKQKQIIKKEGKTLGFIGGTYIMVPDFDKSNFTEIDITKTRTFDIKANSEDIVILPKRNSKSYQLNKVSETETQLVIEDIKEFWSNKYLVIGLDQ